MIELLSTTDPKMIADWVTILFFSVISLFAIILVGSFVAKTVIDMWRAR